MMLALILLIAAALGGVTLLAMRILDKEPPMALGLLHGALGLAGLITLAIQVLGGHAPGTLPKVALALLVLAALGGATVFTLHVQRRPIPLPLLLVHAAVAASGIVCMLIAVLGVGTV
jgi:hypothetical protein